MAEPSRRRARIATTPSPSVFVDSGGYLSVVDQNDQHHPEGAAIFRTIIANHYQQFTTNAVLFEAHALILNRLKDVARAARFLQTVRQSDTRIIRVTEEDEARAEAIINRYTDHAFSFTDALSFTVMQRLSIPNAFAFDRHFREFTEYYITLLTP